MLKKSVKIFILALALATITIALAPSGYAAERMHPPAPPVTGILLAASDGFIIASERKYLVTTKTVIKNKRGKNISVRLLKLQSKLHIEFTFVEKGNFSVPQANLIKVLSEP